MSRILLGLFEGKDFPRNFPVSNGLISVLQQLKLNSRARPLSRYLKWPSLACWRVVMTGEWSPARVHRSLTLILCGSHLAATIRDPRFLEQIAGQPNLGVSIGGRRGGGGSLTGARGGIGIRDQSQQRLDEDEGIILARSSPGPERPGTHPAP